MMYFLADCCRSFTALFFRLTTESLVKRLLPTIRRYGQHSLAVSHFPTNANTTHTRKECDYLVVFDPDNNVLFTFLITQRAGSLQHILDRLSTFKAELNVIERCALSFGYYTEEYGKLIGYYTSRNHRLTVGDHAVLDCCPWRHRLNVMVTRELHNTFQVRSLSSDRWDFQALADKAMAIMAHSNLADRKRPKFVEAMLGDSHLVKVRYS